MKKHILFRSRIAVALLCLSTSSAHAATFNIANGDVTGLKNAINTANANGEDDTIELATNGTYTLTVIDNSENGLPQITPDGGKKLIIHGNGATVQRSTASSTPSFDIFYISPGANVTISDLTIRNGLSYGSVGGIENDGATLTVESCLFTANFGFGGGGIRNDGSNGSATLTVKNCDFTANSGSNGGGGILNDGSNGSGTARLSVNNCVFNGNSSDYLGGGILNYGGGSTATLTVSDCTFNGNSGSGGGGIANYASVGSGGAATSIVSDTTMTGNSATFGRGGAIHNDAVFGGRATLTVRNCTVSGNSAYFYGGGIGNTAGNVEISNCTLGSNSAGTSGGGFYTEYDGAVVHISDSTVSDNSAMGGGGIEDASGIVSITNSTISSNSASTGGGIEEYYTGMVNVMSSIVALNTATSLGPDVSGIFMSQGYNLIGKTDGSTGFTQATDHTGTITSPLDPKLDPSGLRNNGGPTKTIALLSSSLAINNGDPSAPPRDQRGYVRRNAADIGAFEFGGLIPVTLANISTRAFVQTGDNVMIGGVIITGSGQKKVMLRAIGPSLVNHGITNPLQNPTLELHDHTGAVIASNDNWMNAPNRQEIINSGLAPSNNLESAILTSLNPGAYTAIVRGVNNGTGIALVEGYDLDRTAGSKLGNISTRALVETGNNVMIGGLIVTGPDSDQVIVRAIGPSLTQRGITNALADPTLELHDQNGTLLAFNDNWKDTQQAEITATGLAPTNDKESAIVRTLAPGNYTAIVRGKNNTIGVALVEVYGLN